MSTKKKQTTSELKEQNKALLSENEEWRTKVVKALEEYSNGTYVSPAHCAHAMAEILAGTTIPFILDAASVSTPTTEEAKKIEILQNALKFYEENWKEVPFTTPDDEVDCDIEPTEALIEDQGETAMKALRRVSPTSFISRATKTPTK